MHGNRHRLLLTMLLATVATAGTNGFAQDENGPDSVDVYRLGEVVVSTGKIRQVTPTTLQRLNFGVISRTDAPTAAGLAYEIPAARVQTNSRGEALLYMRGAGERQVAIFLDGALLNIPWDNRVDLSLIPLPAVGAITIAKGVPSVLYGANVIGGAVNMVSQEMREQGEMVEAVAQFGQHTFLNGSATYLMNRGDWNVVASVGYTSRDGVSFPADLSLPFNQPAGKIRTNSDLRAASVYARGEYHFSPAATLGLSVNSIFGEKGVPPEGHLEGARFWRYPNWQNTTVTLNGDLAFGAANEWTIRGAAWGARFLQDIEQFTDATYTLLTARQEDRDVTLGTRLVFGRLFETRTIALAVNGLTSTHEQRDLAFDSVGVLIPDDYPTSVFEQQVYSVGLEYEESFADGLVGATLGVSMDGMRAPKTGDKPAIEPFSDYSAMAGLTVAASREVTLRGAVGRKTRFPTMRELFGEALRRFLINPDLKPEEALLAELGGSADFLGWANVSLVGFLNRTSNTIDQRSLDTLGGTKRQRINLPGSRVLGLELTTAIVAGYPFRLDGHFTWMDVHGIGTDTSGADSTFTLSEKPEILATVTASYEFPFGLILSAEAVHTGRAFSPNDDNEFIELAPSTTLNARAAYRFVVPGSSSSVAQLFVRANNLTDAVVLPQLGLPGAGREVQGGLKVTF